ncbi:MAG: TolC family protein [Chitinophagales bacterium]
MYYCKYLLTVLLIYITGNISAQDTLWVSIEAADKLFLQKNLLMIAGQLNVDAQKALEIQARLYPNPQFSMGVNVYDNQNKKILYAGQNGEKSFEFDQLILLGGKRKNQVELAKQNTKQTQLELEDLLRNLKYQLHNNLFSVYFDWLTVNQYDRHLQQLDTIITAYQEQSQKGNIPLKDVVRLKSAYISLNNERAELFQSIEAEQKELRLLLQTQKFVIPSLDDAFWTRFEHLPLIDSLQQLAMQHRSDLQLTSLNRTIADLNIRYQKSLAVPDITLGASYDQRGNAFTNQYMLTAGIPLPFWNRNQGNIKSAEIQSNVAAVNQQQQQSSVNNEVIAAWYYMQRSISEYQKTKQLFNADFTNVFEGMTTNFLKRNISILEFVDFFESYNSGITEVNRVKKQLALSAETINYTVEFPVY